ncbi:MAG: Uma2 family endonuclease [Cyanobacteria bacterium SBLK]|nr:Uma2 family endonuclease [Cyanobacteria bacterium SBLK]
MSVQITREPIPQETAIVDEMPVLPPSDLPYDDGEPLESNRHRIAMNVLIDSLHQIYQGRDDYYAGGNMFIYYSARQARNRDFRGPDFFAVLNVDGTRERRSWMVWEEEGRYPDVIVELMSPSTASVDTTTKKDLYERTFRTPDYFVYNPFDPESLQGWHLESDRVYHALSPNDRGWLWCETLGLWLGTRAGTLTKENATWLRFFDRDGNLILLPQEVARVEQERANREQERANREQERANREQERANREQDEKEQTQTELQELRDRLIAMGLDPDNLPNNS